MPVSWRQIINSWENRVWISYQGDIWAYNTFAKLLRHVYACTRTNVSYYSTMWPVNTVIVCHLTRCHNNLWHVTALLWEILIREMLIVIRVATRPSGYYNKQHLEWYFGLFAGPHCVRALTRTALNHSRYYYVIVILMATSASLTTLNQTPSMTTCNTWTIIFARNFLYLSDVLDIPNTY